jgi:hypothetical protein
MKMIRMLTASGRIKRVPEYEDMLPPDHSNAQAGSGPETGPEDLDAQTRLADWLDGLPWRRKSNL